MEAFTILPQLGFVDGISGAQNQKLMTPAQFGHYYIDQMKKGNPRFAALNYRIVEAQDFQSNPQKQAQAAQKNMRIAEGAIIGEYTENGVVKTEMILITILSGNRDGITTWSANLVAMSGRSGNNDALTQKLGAIWGSQQINPQWEQRRVAMTQQYLAENAREQQTILANQQQQFEAHQRGLEQMRKTNDEIMATRRQMSANSSAALGRTSDMATDAIVGRDNRTNPYTGQTFKSDVNTDYIWVNRDGKAVGTNDSTYNPNHDSSLGGDWQLAPKGY